MDQRQNLIIIKGKDRTEDVRSVSLKENKKEVTFNNGKKYSYLENNLKVFSNPKCIEISNCSVRSDGNLLTNVKEIIDFKDWVKVFHTSGRNTLCSKSQFSILEGKRINSLSDDILGYFRKLAEEVSLKTRDGESLLAMKYKELEVISSESVLYKFIRQQPILETKGLRNFTIFPFGCNINQRVAIEKAISITYLLLLKINTNC